MHRDNPRVFPFPSPSVRRRAVTALAVGLLLSASAVATAATLDVDVRIERRSADPVPADVVLEGSGGGAVSLEDEGVATFANVAPGAYVVMVSADGFDAWSRDLVVEGDLDVVATLFPAADVTFDGVVADDAGSPLVGATVTIDGERIDAPQSATTDAEGAYAFEGVPAGFYDVRVSADSFRPVERTGVDVLGPASMAFTLVDASPAPDVERTRSLTCASAAPTGSIAWGLAFALLAARRRR